MNSKTVILVSVILLLTACSKEQELTANPPTQPNILWLVAEDLSPIINPFGDSTAPTPNLDRLAAEGVRYTNLYSTHGVCAPSRAAIITGMYPTGIGANHMRTNSNMDATGLPAYEAVPPSGVRMFTEFLREAGYYTSNSAKEDYQFAPPVTGWDESSEFAHWRNRGINQPFFSVFNFNITHESSLFEPYGFKIDEERFFEAGNRDFKLAGWNVRTPEEETPVLVSKDADFPIPPYLPDSEISRRDLWKTYNSVARMDEQIGAILDQLEEDGLLENTIIFFFADHGGPLPRQKRLIYDSGLNSPMIIRFPDKQNAGSTDDQLISFVDFASTVLSIAGIEPRRYMQGQAFLGQFKAKTERRYIHAATDRLDEYTDARRAVRSHKFKYIRNYRPQQGYYLPVSYREQIPVMQELLTMRDEGSLDEIQSQWFREEKPREELFDLESDPHELNNLAGDQHYSETIRELSQEMDRWLDEIGDDPDMAESALITQLWQGSDAQPQTLNPEVSFSEGGHSATITSKTQGASIGYKLIVDGIEAPAWDIYTGEPIKLPANAGLKVQAHRIGYLKSETLVFSSPELNEAH